MPNYSGKKSRIRETPTLLTDADSGTDTNLKRKRDLSKTRRGSPVDDRPSTDNLHHFVQKKK